MRLSRAAIYSGFVTHQRVAPTLHRLKYRVFSLLLPLDDLDSTVAGCRLLSRNRFNMFSIHDKDYGEGKGQSLEAHLAGLVEEAGFGGTIRSSYLLTYPRVFGYVFNPLSIYFCCDSDNRVRLLVYEVSNTFGERRSYVVPVESATEADGTIANACAKEMYVSPFNDVTGDYRFRLRKSAGDLFVGILLRRGGKPLLNARFSASESPLNDRRLIMSALRMPFMTFKVFAGIHLEAARLWLKKLPLQKRPGHPVYAATIYRKEQGQ